MIDPNSPIASRKTTIALAYTMLSLPGRCDCNFYLNIIDLLAIRNMAGLLIKIAKKFPPQLYHPNENEDLIDYKNEEIE